MKVALIVQARMGSSRLPGKVLMQAAGRSMLAHQIERLRTVRNANEIIVATTVEPADDAIAQACTEIGVACFRGSENDVLSRFVGAATQCKADVIVRLTADCPLIDPAVIESVIFCYLENPHERLYVSNTLERTFPRGMDTEVFSWALLDEAGWQATSTRDREHVTPYVIRNDHENIEQRNVTCSKNLSAYRFTLDYPKDLRQISRLLESSLPNFSLGTLMQYASSLGYASHDNDEQEAIAPPKLSNCNTAGNPVMHRFGLGTAQFGMFYGRFNRDGVPSRDTVSEMLCRAGAFGINGIDTAHLYGEAELVLGSCADALGSYSIVTKTPRFSDSRINPADALFLRETFLASLSNMGQTAVDGLLIHHAPNLLADGGDLLYNEMVRLKEEGYVKRIGVSAYTGEVVEAIQEKYALDLVQLPINVLDRRLIDSGSLSRIASKGTKIHARSAFLQGLLLADPAGLSQHFQPVRSQLEAFHAACKTNGVLPAHAALHFLLAIPDIGRIIVGIESIKQLNEVFSDFPAHVDMDFEPYRVDSLEILNPVLWVN